MPEISRFWGIVIGMFYREHGLPHFHAVYGNLKVAVIIRTRVVSGQSPEDSLRG